MKIKSSVLDSANISGRIQLKNSVDFYATCFYVVDLPVQASISDNNLEYQLGELGIFWLGNETGAYHGMLIFNHYNETQFQFFLNPLGNTNAPAT